MSGRRDDRDREVLTFEAIVLMSAFWFLLALLWSVGPA